MKKFDLLLKVIFAGIIVFVVSFFLFLMYKIWGIPGIIISIVAIFSVGPSLEF